jgi:hypothetical protein
LLLDHNMLTGEISPLGHIFVNRLSGEIPSALTARFNASSFPGRLDRVRVRLLAHSRDCPAHLVSPSVGPWPITTSSKLATRCSIASGLPLLDGREARNKRGEEAENSGRSEGCFRSFFAPLAREQRQRRHGRVWDLDLGQDNRGGMDEGP